MTKKSEKQKVAKAAAEISAVSNLEKEHQMDELEISVQLDELIKQWFALKSDNSEQELFDILRASICQYSPEQVIEEVNIRGNIINVSRCNLYIVRI